MARRRRGRRLAGWTLVGLVVLAVAGFGGPEAFVQWRSHGRIMSVADVPATPVALVLGAEVQPDGEPSAFLRARLEVAKQLFDAGTVKVVLVSGDNGSVHYNEPDAMKRWLVRAGVPANKVVEDFAGFDTYDSCVRAKRIFGVDRAIVVSQPYHLPRAVAACRSVGVDAWGVGDTTTQRAFPQIYRAGQVREVAANVKLIVDLATRRTPTLGKPETGVRDALAGG